MSFTFGIILGLGLGFWLGSYVTGRIFSGKIKTDQPADPAE